MNPRREFLRTTSAAGAALVAQRLAAATAAPDPAATRAPAARTFDEWIRQRHARVISAERIDGFFSPRPNNQWAKFDAELGYESGLAFTCPSCGVVRSFHLDVK